MYVHTFGNVYDNKVMTLCSHCLYRIFVNHN